MNRFGRSIRRLGPSFQTRSIFRTRRKLHEMLLSLSLSSSCDGISRWQMELIYLIVAKRRVFERGGESNAERTKRARGILQKMQFGTVPGKLLKEK